MRSNPTDKELTELLLEASVQHMRATMETLPIGVIELSAAGLIESIDLWTEQALGYCQDELRGTSITVLLDESGFDIIDGLAAMDTPYDAPLLLRTKQGGSIATQAAVIRDESALHRSILSLVFIQT